MQNLLLLILTSVCAIYHIHVSFLFSLFNILRVVKPLLLCQNCAMTIQAFYSLLFIYVEFEYKIF